MSRYEYAAAIPIVAQQLLEEQQRDGKIRRVTAFSILVRMGVFARVSQYRNRLPRTTAALEAVAESWEDRGVRVLRSLVSSYRREGVVPTKAGILDRGRLYYTPDTGKLSDAIAEALAELQSDIGATEVAALDSDV